MIPSDWSAWDRRYRANFFNSLSGFRSVGLLTTFSPENVAGAAVFSQVLHVGANPPQMGFLFRPPGPNHHALAHLRAAGAFAFHVMAGDRDMALAVHQCAAAYPEGTSELEAVGFTWRAWPEVHAPIVDQALVQIGLVPVEEHALGNGTILVVGEIRRVEAPRLARGDDGYWDLAGAGALTTNGLDAYHHATPLVRATYAVPDGPARPLDGGTS